MLHQLFDAKKDTNLDIKSFVKNIVIFFQQAL